MTEDSNQEDSVEERWLSVDEVASRLGVKRDSVYKLIKRDGLPAHKMGKKLWRFSIKEVDSWVRSRGKDAA